MRFQFMKEAEKDIPEWVSSAVRRVQSTDFQSGLSRLRKSPTKVGTLNADEAVSLYQPAVN
jgi:hypothetical protein